MGELNGREVASARGAGETAGTSAEAGGRVGAAGEVLTALEPGNERFGIGAAGGAVGVGVVVGRLKDEPGDTGLGAGSGAGFRTTAGDGRCDAGTWAGAGAGRAGTAGVGALSGTARSRGEMAVGASPAGDEGGVGDAVEAAGTAEGWAPEAAALGAIRGVAGRGGMAGRFGRSAEAPDALPGGRPTCASPTLEAAGWVALGLGAAEEPTEPGPPWRDTSLRELPVTFGVGETGAVGR